MEHMARRLQRPCLAGPSVPRPIVNCEYCGRNNAATRIILDFSIRMPTHAGYGFCVIAPKAIVLTCVDSP